MNGYKNFKAPLDCLNSQSFFMKILTSFIYFIAVGILFFMNNDVAAQPKHYTVANAHSHNDYEQDTPFYKAYNAGFGSIEADIFLVKGKLIVAHDIGELQKNRSLEDYYIKPLLAFVEKNKGRPYNDKHRILQMLIDVKSAAVITLDSLIAVLKRFPPLISNKTIQWVISGNRPPDSTFNNYPSFIWFDGILSKDYSSAALQKIVMMSDDFKNYHTFGNDGQVSVTSYKLINAIMKAHKAGKKVRFWDAPDNASAWLAFMRLGVDFINTDKIDELANFLKAAH